MKPVWHRGYDLLSSSGFLNRGTICIGPDNSLLGVMWVGTDLCVIILDSIHYTPEWLPLPGPDVENVPASEMSSRGLERSGSSREALPCACTYLDTTTITPYRFSSAVGDPSLNFSPTIDYRSLGVCWGISLQVDSVMHPNNPPPSSPPKSPTWWPLCCTSNFQLSFSYTGTAHQSIRTSLNLIVKVSINKVQI